MKPIGHWLCRTDRALTATMDALLADLGLTRLTWQVLNVLNVLDVLDGPADDPEAGDTRVRAVLAANADAGALTAAVEAVLAGGWAVRPQPGRLALTDAGRDRLAEAGARIGAFRELSTAGISAEEYRTAVSVLERMTRNLERAA
ncbi:MarR family transcriptional regulator [Streptomyces sp. NPDC058157]|uniref:MarR family transcriptional regulator n=1 Tax=Streptomyces sp. NPDC058157 TaxID=3346360 RepID=UPI0036F0B224